MALPTFRYLVWRTLREARRRRRVGVLSAAGILVASLLLHSIVMFIFDGAVREDLTFVDCLWCSLVSVTTIGYGDFYASSLGARIGTVVLVMGVGLSATTFLLGIMVDNVVELALKEKRGMNRIMARDHILIVNFPSEGRVAQIVEEFRSDESHRQREFVVITDQIEELPASMNDLLFVRGSPLEPGTFERANIDEAREAIVLSPSYSDSHADSVVASALSIIATLRPGLFTVGECLNDKHRPLFSAVSCDAVVSTFDLVNKLIVQESQDAGVITFLSRVASNRAEGTLFSLPVPKAVDGGRSYGELATTALKIHVNILCVLRGNEAHTRLFELKPIEGDKVLYIADRRVGWGEVAAG